MNKVEKRKILVLALGVLTCSTAGVFGSDKVDLELTADFKGKYIWRGQNVTDDSPDLFYTQIEYKF